MTPFEESIYPSLKTWDIKFITFVFYSPNFLIILEAKEASEF